MDTVGFSFFLQFSAKCFATVYGVPKSEGDGDEGEEGRVAVFCCRYSFCSCCL